MKMQKVTFTKSNAIALEASLPNFFKQVSKLTGVEDISSPTKIYDGIFKSNILFSYLDIKLPESITSLSDSSKSKEIDKVVRAFVRQFLLLAEQEEYDIHIKSIREPKTSKKRKKPYKHAKLPSKEVYKDYILEDDYNKFVLQILIEEGTKYLTEDIILNQILD